VEEIINNIKKDFTTERTESTEKTLKKTSVFFVVSVVKKENQ